jgi:hypothetical protein
MLQYAITVFKCSTCGKISHESSNMRKHRCSGTPNLKRLVGHVVVADDSTEHQRRRPGAKAVNPGSIMRKSIGSRDEDSDDRRIDFAFASGLIVEFLAIREASEIPAFLFERLWGKRAPPEFQSLILLRGMVHEVESGDPDVEIETATLLAPTRFAPAFSKEFGVYLLEFAFSVCKHSVPGRIPDDDISCSHALRLLGSLRATDLRNRLRVPGRLDSGAREFVTGFHAVVSREISTAFNRAY